VVGVGKLIEGGKVLNTMTAIQCQQIGVQGFWVAGNVNYVVKAA